MNRLPPNLLSRCFCFCLAVSLAGCLPGLATASCFVQERDDKQEESGATASKSKSDGIPGTRVGDEVKHIEGKDVDGVSFSLDDYRGKVMMIDFWGDW